MSAPVIARAPDTVRRVAGNGPLDLAEARRRLVALRTIAWPGVVVPLDVEADGEGRVIVIMPRVKGDDLAVVRRLRGGLAAGECVAVGMDVAHALRELHRAGLSHGDISPTNIVLTGARAVLIDTLAGASRSERGTSGFSAPERVVAATPAGDIYALGRVLEYLASEEALERVRAWTGPLCALAPEARPPADEVARALRTCADPTPVALPSSSVAAMVRARALPPEEQTVRLASGRAWRVRRDVVHGLIKFAAAGAGAAVVTLVVAAGGQFSGDPVSGPTAPSGEVVIAASPGGNGTAPLPDEAAILLVEGRIAALAAGDSEALLALTDPAGSAREADSAVAARLGAGALTYESLTVDVTAAETLVASELAATVRVTYTVPAHRLEDAETVIDVPETVAVVDHDIAFSEGSWRIVATRPRP